MAVRDSMEDLVGKVRLELGDMILPYKFTDLQIQNQLDRRRREVSFVPLKVDVSYLPGGTVQYLDFWAPWGDIEADASLVDGSYNVLVPSLSEPMIGHWKFGSSVQTTVYLSGRRYDVYGTAADLCGTWLARIKLDVGDSSRNSLGQRSERITNLQALEKSLRAKSWVITSEFVRNDIRPTVRTGW